MTIKKSYQFPLRLTNSSMRLEWHQYRTKDIRKKKNYRPTSLRMPYSSIQSTEYSLSFQFFVTFLSLRYIIRCTQSKHCDKSPEIIPLCEIRPPTQYTNFNCDTLLLNFRAFLYFPPIIFLPQTGNRLTVTMFWFILFLKSKQTPSSL